MLERVWRKGSPLTLLMGTHTGHEETALEDTNDQWARQDPVLFMLLTSRTFNVKYTRPKTSNDACVVEALLTLKK